MTEEKPHPEMTDQDLLEKLLPIALGLLETDRDRGEPLWEIFKYPEKRFTDGEDRTKTESAREIQASKIEFHNANVTIYLTGGNNHT